ncbi:MAG: RNA polymerase sigma factor [Kordiimonadaceae bacterium]|nr:RNA polymerase sigma factor [Kordiimonadaceae bacterium]
MKTIALSLKEGGTDQQEQKLGDSQDALNKDEIQSLFQRHNDELVRYLVGRLKSRDEAIEVAQEAYVRLLRLDDTSTIGFLRAFLFRTATNLAIDRQRKRGHAVAYAENEKIDPNAQVFECTPERQVAGRQSLDRVVECIESLPPKCRHTFIEFKFRNRSYEDIAAEMGITTSMVRKYVLRALVYCTEQLGDELDAWGG